MTSVSTTPTTPAAGMVRRVLQQVILPTERDLDVLPLYVDQDKASLDLNTKDMRGPARAVADTMSRAGSNGSTEHLDPQAIVDRRRVIVRAGERLSFGTYFNGFAASYWRRWTVVSDVILTVSVSGQGSSVIVYRSMPDGRSQRAEAFYLEDADKATVEFVLPLKPFSDGGWYWFDLVAGAQDARLESADWSADVPEDRAHQGTVTIGITTMNRPDFCAALLSQIGSDAAVADILDRVLVIEQGTQLVTDSPEFPEAQASLGEKLRVIEQGNIGGSGGFARAQFESLQAGESDYVLFLDDDIEAEPAGILRAATFADLARRPTIVGGHMFSIYSKARLHSFGEIINKWRFWWESPSTVHPDWDFGARNLRSTRWLHRRIDVDFNGWFMCLIPLSVVRDIGLSLPLFIKWDDSEYGVRASEHGYPTVTLPGAAVWHVPWTDKNDALDWQAYFHQRNRFIAALLHSPYERGGRMIVESFNHQVKHLFSMQYSTVAMRHQALEDVFKGPQALHGDLPTKLPEIRKLRGQYLDADAKSDPDAFPAVKRAKPPKRGVDPTQPKGRFGQYASMGVSAVRQFLPKRELSDRFPEASIPAMDSKWYMIAQFDSVLVSAADGTSSAWYHRDPEEFKRLLSATVDIHKRLYREWERLSLEYRASLEDITSAEQWEQTFARSVGE